MSSVKEVMTNIEKPWCVVVKLHGMFAIRSFKTRQQMRDDYKKHKEYGYKCKTFRQISNNRSEFGDVIHYEDVS